jgi:hypothetical protein
MTDTHSVLRLTDRQGLASTPIGSGPRFWFVLLFLIALALACPIFNFVSACQASDQSFPLSQANLFDDDTSEPLTKPAGSRGDVVCLASTQVRSGDLVGKHTAFDADLRRATKSRIRGANSARAPPLD